MVEYDTILTQTCFFYAFLSTIGEHQSARRLCVTSLCSTAAQTGDGDEGKRMTAWLPSSLRSAFLALQPDNRLVMRVMGRYQQLLLTPWRRVLLHHILTLVSVRVTLTASQSDPPVLLSLPIVVSSTPDKKTTTQTKPQSRQRQLFKYLHEELIEMPVSSKGTYVTTYGTVG